MCMYVGCVVSVAVEPTCVTGALYLSVRELGVREKRLPTE